VTRLLELSDVDAYYGMIHALKGINLYIDEGEIVTLIGANGAGKSTTLKTISGLVKAKTGTVTFAGHGIHLLPPHKVTQLGIAHIPEGRKIFPRLTVRENLEVGAYTIGNAREVATAMEGVFELFPRLKERANQQGGTLSGGEQQMLAVGRGLMLQPRLLMLDEPSMGLAPIVVEQIFETLRKLNKQGVTILLVEQNAHLALQVATRGYVVQTGAIALADTAANLQENEMVKEAYLGA